MNVVNVEAIAWAKARSRTKLSGPTMHEYQQKYDKMMREGVVPGTSAVQNTRQTQRAAARYVLANEILKANNVGDIHRMETLWKQVQAIQLVADVNVQAYEAGDYVESRRMRDSKKFSIKNLPDDWRKSVISTMSQHKHADAVRVLACAGCRPAELEMGVEVYRDADGIHFTIQGAKISEKKGQLWREITLQLDHPIAMTIPNGTYYANPESITKAIARKASKLGFEGVSAYSFRHQFSSDLKASNYDKKTIAKAMGHQSTATQQTYGNSGAGRPLQVSVESAKTPRVWVKSTKPKPSKKPKIR